MFHWIRNFFSKRYMCAMELHNNFGCYVSVYHPSNNSIEGFNEFFNRNHFLIAHNMFDEEWDEKTRLEEIFKKLILIYNFSPSDKNIVIVYKNHKQVYLPNGEYIPLPPRSIFVYDQSKIKISY